MLYSVSVFARAKQMFVCRVAPLVEHCDTCLWLLSALCWLVVNSGEVLPEFFSVGSGRGELVCVLVKVLPRITLLSLLAEVLPRSARCLFWATIVLPLWFKVCRLVGPRSGEVLPGRLLALLVEVIPKAASCCFGCRCSLSVEMSCRCCRSNCRCDNLFGRCRSRCCALGRVSGHGAGQVVFLFVFEFSWLCLWSFVCPHGQVFCFVSCALHVLPDGGLVSAVGVWLAVPLGLTNHVYFLFIEQQKQLDAAGSRRRLTQARACGAAGRQWQAVKVPRSAGACEQS
ncbi:hypothetical protein Taro_043987 [Colocasia esculenta]|uniref:Uncharacterized protein n=1 Tax=Colocasia esculenta TaxID=4460 RepID=A0A843X1T2_COLES|nr:hypothetical protein [Colocasia esculenta]